MVRRKEAGDQPPKCINCDGLDHSPNKPHDIASRLGEHSKELVVWAGRRKKNSKVRACQNLGELLKPVRRQLYTFQEFRW